MTEERKKSLAQRSALLTGAIVIVCVAYLLGDYAFNRYHSPHDKDLAKTMEQEVKRDAQVAITLLTPRTTMWSEAGMVIGHRGYGMA